MRRSRLRRVINATGVIVHTNLGRAPLSEAAIAAITEDASGYCTLEYDIETGKRGRRGAYAESLIAELTGAESALIVNNCAAAAFLVLSVLAAGREVIVSRGELVEIGGDFRVPDVLAQSGAVLREVGTTNRTKIADYEKAVTDETALILRVHPSNYRIVGFTESPELGGLAALAHKKKIQLYEDAGSGVLTDLSAAGLADEPVISHSIEDGADIVTFSGDKLLGGPQCGIIVGRAEVVESIRKHPLYRALRAGKMVYAALGATLESFARGSAVTDIPVLRMLHATNAELAERSRRFASQLLAGIREGREAEIDVIEGNSAVGGGAAPGVALPTSAITVSHPRMSPSAIEQSLRTAEPPVIARIAEDKVLIDLRTVPEPEEAGLRRVLTEVLNK